MSGLQLALALSSGGEPPAFVESRIDVDADRFEYQLSDVDDDRRVDLLVTSSAPGERSLRLWRQRADSTFPAVPDFRMGVPPDVVSWSLFDVRSEPGRELLLLTRGGLFSLTTTRPGLQGNLRREIALPLFPDLADPDRLPCWRLHEDVDGDGEEEFLVVSGRELVALGVARAADGATCLAPKLRLPISADEEESSLSRLSIGNAGLTVTGRSGEAALFPGARTSRPSFDGEPLFSRRTSFKLPALVDWDGDRRLDLVEFGPRAISIRRQQADSSFAPEAQILPNPPPMIDARASGSASRDYEGREHVDLVDLDGDGRRELVGFRDEGGSTTEHVALVFPRDAEGRPAQEPSARVKLAGMDVEFRFVDVDGDGRLDLTARVLDVPTGLTSLATIRLDVAFHVFRGHEGATLSRQPDLSFERSFRPEQLGRVQETLLTRIDGDFDRDGVNDLVLTQLDGRVEVRTVRRDGERLELAAKPLASFMPPAPVERMETWDLSRDGVADLMLRHERGFTLFVSKRRESP